MDAIVFAIIIVVAIAGPSVLALVRYWRANPDRRLSWRRVAENAGDTDPEHFRRPSWQAWPFMGGGHSGGGHSGGGGGGDSSGGGGSS